MPQYMLRKIGKNDYTKVFLLCLLTSGMMFLPTLLMNKGLFSLVGDFNYQQIPFNILSNRAIKSGDIFWNWYTDLGSNFIGSYSFYTLGSPFFWLSLLFPPFAFPYVVAPLLMLKYCTAGLTAYAYIRRYVKDGRYAIIGALLYAFSGFSTVNLMFNHFHDVIALFPLLLFGLDRLVLNKKCGWFAAAVALNATLNFFFFTGEVVFLLLYFIVRFLAEDFKRYVRRLPAVLLEGVIGVGMAGVLLLPAVLFTLQNPRLDAFLYGPTALIFDGRRYLELLKAFFMPADIMPHQSAIYPSDFTSSGAWLPLFGPVAVFALLIGSKKSWMSRLFKVLVVMACVPLLNSLFYAFNASYYARWLYMPVLIMALMTAVVLEKREAYPCSRALLVTSVVTGLLAGFLLFYPWSESQKSAVLQMDLFLFYLCSTAAGLTTAYYLLIRFRNARRWMLFTTIGVVLFSGGLGFFNIASIHSIYPWQSPQAIEDTVVKTGQEVKRVLPDREDYRISISDNGWNLPMVSQTPTVNSFTSMVNGSIFQFYESIGSPRDVKTIIPEDYYGLKPLLSVGYAVQTQPRAKQKPYASFFNGTNTIYIYKNPDALPVGFTYDYYLTESRFDHIADQYKHLVLLKAAVLPDGEVNRVRNRMLPLPESQIFTFEKNDYRKDLEARQKEASRSFHHDARGFTSEIDVDANKFAFFSVPYDKGWSATVNGRAVQIINSDGFMMVPVYEGKNIIRFNYHTPGLTAGIFLSLVSGSGFIVWIFRRRLFKRKMIRKRRLPQQSLFRT
ncbi:YfhO family protein [Sporolactobacillus sp. Y61]|uniref:YfhO family protein n=1 Tax=Sporolactobacillus sp. Y61 TaxID=3160863 RepID=A0AAU8IJ39_9BACL